MKPLRDPHTVLERIDLRIGPRDHLTPGPTELDDVEVVSTLQDLLDQPNNVLQAILFRRPRQRENFWEEMDEPHRSLIQQLHKALRDRVVKNQAKCGFCERVLVEVLNAEELLVTAAHGRCSCGLYSCGKSGCPTVSPYGECAKSYCNSCRSSMNCDLCHGHWCEDCACKRVGFCKDCSTSFCEDCKRVGFCEGCSRSFCEDCNQVGFCDECHESSCENCKQVGFCEGCSRSFCEDCNQVGFCDECYTSVCEDCEQVNFCEECSRSFCTDCKQVRYCVGCYTSVCTDCKQVGFCEGCHTSVCEDCNCSC